MREFTRRDGATFGGRLTGRWTWFVSPLYLVSSAWKPAHTSRMTCSLRAGCVPVDTSCRYFGTGTRRVGKTAAFSVGGGV